MTRLCVCECVCICLSVYKSVFFFLSNSLDDSCFSTCCDVFTFTTRIYCEWFFFCIALLPEHIYYNLHINTIPATNDKYTCVWAYVDIVYNNNIMHFNKLFARKWASKFLAIHSVRSVCLLLSLIFCFCFCFVVTWHIWPVKI